jgi:hypothetical protein
MNLTAKKVPFSSVVGQIVTIHDQAGAVVAQLSIHNVRTDLPYRETADDIADLIVMSFNDEPESDVARREGR